jgi:hypothetical protein
MITDPLVELWMRGFACLRPGWAPLHYDSLSFVEYCCCSHGSTDTGVILTDLHLMHAKLTADTGNA